MKTKINKKPRKTVQNNKDDFDGVDREFDFGDQSKEDLSVSLFDDE